MALSIKKTGKIYSLENNGTPCSCPFSTRVVVPGRMAGTMELNVAQCSEACPLVEIIQDLNGAFTVSICQDRKFAGVKEVKESSLKSI